MKQLRYFVVMNVLLLSMTFGCNRCESKCEQELACVPDKAEVKKDCRRYCDLYTKSNADTMRKIMSSMKLGCYVDKVIEASKEHEKSLGL